MKIERVGIAGFRGSAAPASLAAGSLGFEGGAVAVAGVETGPSSRAPVPGPRRVGGRGRRGRVESR